VFVQAARGVLALHDRRLVHFDLKPSNVFLKGDVARVGDYGLSKLLDAGRMTLSIGRGTPQYMAPEILRSRADHRADIYSLGVILYESLTGALPYKPDGGGALVLREDDTPPGFPDGGVVPPRVREVICRCLRLAPEDRYTDVAALLADLGQSARLGESVTIPFELGALPAERADGGLHGGASPEGAAPGDPAVAPTPKVPSRALAAALAAERAARERGVVDAVPSADGSTAAPDAPAHRARALVRGLAEFQEVSAAAPPPRAHPVPAPPAPPSPHAAPVPVPPRISGGVVGHAIATARIGFEIFLALLAGLVRAALVAWRALVDRLLRRKGNAAGRAARFLLFLLVMAALGFVVTLLGMVGLLFLEQASQRA
jgi:hypothetical protein